MKKNKVKYGSFVVSAFIVLMLGIMTEAKGYEQDPRVPAGSHELAPAVGRLVDNNGLRMCTGWITNGGILITAGHCKEGGAVRIEFNVPNSDPSTGIPNDPALGDIYTISSWIDWENTGIDNDWALFRVNDNGTTGLQPIEAQLVFIDLQQDLTGADCRTMGYGSDNDNKSRNYTLQMDVGENETTNPTGNYVRCETHGTGGGSGGPFIDDATNKAFGIVRTSNYFPDKQEGTSTRRSSFWTAYQNELTSFNLKVYQKMTRVMTYPVQR